MRLPPFPVFCPCRLRNVAAFLTFDDFFLPSPGRSYGSWRHSPFSRELEAAERVMDSFLPPFREWLVLFFLLLCGKVNQDQA